MFVMVMVKDAMMDIIVESVYILWRLVRPYTIPKEEPIRIIVTILVINFLRTIEQLGMPIFHHMISSGSGALRRTNSFV